MEKDYYKILGIDRNASEDDIKKAFRKMSKQYHPDRQSGKSEEEKRKCEEKMKEINEAYETLSDKDKRYTYDNGGPRSPFGDMDMDDFMRGFGFGGGFHRHREPEKQRGGDIQIKIKVGINEILNGCTKKIKFKRNVRCHVCDGVGGTKKTTCPYCHGQGFIDEQRQVGPNTFFRNTRTCPHCGGKGYKFEHTCPNCNSTGFEEKEEIIDIIFEPGIIQGNAYTAIGRGHESPDKDGPTGTFYAIPIYDVDTEKYNLDNFPHIVHKVKLNWVDALLGGKMSINLEGIGKKEVEIPQCTKPGDVVVLNGCGAKLRSHEMDWMGNRSTNDIQGDYILAIDYSLPKKLSDKQKSLLKQIKEIS